MRLHLKLKPSENVDSVDNSLVLFCVGRRADQGPNSWRRSRWVRGYQSTDNLSIMLPPDYDYLSPTSTDAPRTEANYSETRPKTVAFDTVSDYQLTTPNDANPGYASIQTSTTSSARRAATAAAGTAAATSPSPIHPPLPSLPHTLRSDRVREPVYSALDFRSTNNGSGRRDDNNNNVCRRCRRSSQPDDGMYCSMTVGLANH